MFLRLCSCNIILLIIFCLSSVVVSQYVNITLPLNKTLTLLDKELYGGFHTIKSNSTIKVNLVDVNDEVSYVIFQVHSHLFNLTLYNNTRAPMSTISGTNVGLYSATPELDTFYIANENGIDLKLYISVHGYSNKDPIPGGSNMEFPIYISPFMHIKYNKDYINVDAQPADPIKSKVLFYGMYLWERDFSTDGYFDGIKNMITLQNIQQNGYLIANRDNPSIMRRFLSAYPGTGSIYVAVAYNNMNDSFYSVYVPTYTYACSPVEDNDCDLLDNVVSQFFCACLLFVGMFTCFLGHRFFKTEMFLVGMFCGIIITYILMSMTTHQDTPVLLMASVTSGVFFGIIWLLFWWFYGIPLLAVLLATLHLGFLISTIIYYRLPGEFLVVQEDGKFWTLFILVMLLTSGSLVATTLLSNLLCCAVLGSYAVVFSIDHYIGSNLKYIFINTVRRAVVGKFKYAVLAPPFQWRDALMTLLWVSLALMGAIVQYNHSRGKPPFPPPPRDIRFRLSDDSLPIFRANRTPRYGAISERDSTVSAVATDANAAERNPLL